MNKGGYELMGVEGGTRYPTISDRRLRTHVPSYGEAGRPDGGCGSF